MDTMLATPDPIADIPAETLSTSGDQMMGPPYDAQWIQQYVDRRVFWTAIRAQVHSGHLVGQLGQRDGTSSSSFGLIEVGFQKRFKAQQSGTHQVVVRFDAGPITQINGARVAAFAFMDGVGRRYTSLASYRTSYIAFRRELVADQWYKIVAAGTVSALTRPGAPTVYGEVIANVPRISVRKTAVDHETRLADYVAQRNAQIDELGDVDAVAAALAEEDGVDFDGSPLALEEALRAAH